ncbi:hypothetical protein Back11_16980 [Paenibacillus baekrokdamisoli]|uniref:Uncharacterized protein n=1 Tax=Paenibacillus baekrokdamisoli TaxID=1712516 RepID=A0A3G9J6A1_9BACL|nr:GerAB/ArcD/ProY family transporter [Paenibacillus baekrokdamisoli]MBB3072052.1 spore germination protein KB [Paenibacillus baekrokdamisoli]BBH20353.1 hypothetical protein Back11_16980 [Paenibacillus baekrokdamisoli]
MKTQISNGMLVSLIIIFAYPKAIGITQGIIVRDSGGDMLLATCMAMVQGLFVMLLTVFIVRKIPGSNFIDQAQILIGSAGAKLVGLVLFLFFCGAFGATMITYVYHIRDHFLPEAPIALFIIVALIVGVYANYHGFEVIGRLALIGLFSVVIFNILMLIGSTQDFDIKELLPVFQSGFWNTVKASRHNDTDWAVATLMIAIILPMVKDEKMWGKSSVTGIIMGWITILMWPIFEAGNLSPEVTGQYLVPCLQLSRSAELGHFIHRYEMFMIAFFAIPLFVQISMCLFCASHVAAQVLKLQDRKPTLIPVSLLLGGVGYWVVSDRIRAMDLLAMYWPPAALTVAFGLPILLLVLGFLFKKNIGK